MLLAGFGFKYKPSIVMDMSEKKIKKNTKNSL